MEDELPPEDPETFSYCSSASTVFGPTLDEGIIYFLGLVLPENIRKKLGLIEDGTAKQSTAPPRTSSVEKRAKRQDRPEVDMEDWIRTEYLALSRDVARCCLNTNEATRCPIDPSMLEARRYVLNRLAELMEKKQILEAEYRSKLKERGDARYYSPCN